LEMCESVEVESGRGFNAVPGRRAVGFPGRRVVPLRLVTRGMAGAHPGTRSDRASRLANEAVAVRMVAGGDCGCHALVRCDLGRTETGVRLFDATHDTCRYHSDPVFGKVVVTTCILLENSGERIEGVSGRAFGPGLAFITRCGAGHTGFAGNRGPRRPIALSASSVPRFARGAVPDPALPARRLH
jgi:hypothetical protein